jgi:putative redox protein
MEQDTIEITSRWLSGLSFEAAGTHGIPIEMGSSDDSPANTPMELALMALAGCTGMDVVSILEKKRQPVRSLEIRVRGARAEEPPRVYTNIEIEFQVAGEALTPEAVARAIELSETKYCSVGAMLGKSARVHTSYKILPWEAPHE